MTRLIGKCSKPLGGDVSLDFPAKDNSYSAKGWKQKSMGYSCKEYTYSSKYRSRYCILQFGQITEVLSALLVRACKYAFHCKVSTVQKQLYSAHVTNKLWFDSYSEWLSQKHRQTCTHTQDVCWVTWCFCNRVSLRKRRVKSSSIRSPSWQDCPRSPRGSSNSTRTSLGPTTSRWSRTPTRSVYYLPPAIKHCHIYMFHIQYYSKCFGLFSTCRCFFHRKIVVKML
jgi:hypothetical protein